MVGGRTRLKAHWLPKRLRLQEVVVQDELVFLFSVSPLVLTVCLGIVEQFNEDVCLEFVSKHPQFDKTPE